MKSTLSGVFCTIILLSFGALAEIHKPADYVDSQQRQVRFVKFASANHQIFYNTQSKQATYKTKIAFTMDQSGFPVFDLVTPPEKVFIDGAIADQVVVSSPDNATQFRVINSQVSSGNHILEVQGELVTLVSFGDSTVKSAFWTTDLSDRGYLEKYLPTNLEYDQFPVTLDIQISGTDNPHIIFANGEVTQIKTNQFRVDFSSKYTTSSHFFHLGPASDFYFITAYFTSMTKKAIPVTVYKLTSDTNVDVNSFLKVALENMAELENTYGPYAHPQMLIYATSTRVGMEYSGATMTMDTALTHELAHSWFARAAMPANGNAGWLDESITVWRDRGYKQRTSLATSHPKANHGIYNRHTDTDAYSFGADFIELLSVTTNGLKGSLSSFFKDQKWIPYTTESFSNDLSHYANADLTPLFKQYVYGAASEKAAPENLTQENFNSSLSFILDLNPPTDTLQNPMHPYLSDEELKKLL